VSRATKTFLAFESVPMAKPILEARVGVKSTLAKPRIPELPKSFVKSSLLPEACVFLVG